MPRGKLRSPEEIARMQKDIRRQYRPLVRQTEILAIREKMLDWVMGGDDQFIVPEESVELESADEAAGEVEA